MPQYKSETVLLKIGDSKPLISNIEEDQWVLISSSQDITVDSIYANIAIKEYENAEKLARSHLKQNPSDLHVFEALARALVANKKVELASYYATYVLEKDSKRTAMYNIKALAKSISANSMADYNIAKDLFRRAYTGPNKSIAAGLNLGYLQLETGALNMSKEVFNDVAKTCGKCAPAMLGLGIIDRRLGNLKSSIYSLEEALDSDSTKHIASYHIALSYRQLKQYEKAKNFLKNISEELTSDDNILLSKAESLLQQINIEMEDEYAE